ncbi:hypothetical protein GALL_463740 [mine drainage metagenome]|uniref:YkuD domain-containing protein n=1 Tax=mine drainage metagenome TaxID=410659 RepID=A0A1J5Q7T5_9ZZZZ
MRRADNQLKKSWRAPAVVSLMLALLPATALPGRAQMPSQVISTSTSAQSSADATITSIPNSQWAAIVAAGAWRAGCPVGQTGLRRVSVNFHGFDGKIQRGVLVVRTDAASSVARIFTRLFAAGFPIHSMKPIEAYKGDDNASMAADNTSAFNCRRTSQSNAPVTSSPHANGRAIDVNPYENPWVDPRCNCFRPDSKYAKHRSGPGVITKGSTAWKIFTAEGWIWQDNSTPDYQHFDTGYPSRPLSTAHATALPFSVPVTVGNATQIITVKAVGSAATLTAWARRPDGWHAFLSTKSARIGAKGIANGATRRQNTNTTPSGTYTLTQAFGIMANPGTTLPYHLVTKSDWWVEDNNSAYYNSLRSSAQGGFDTSAPESSVNGSEHLITHVGQYDYAIVVDYNMSPSVPYRGAGIFIHVSTGYPTAGCVALPRKTLVSLMRWLKPSAHPRIAIG